MIDLDTLSEETLKIIVAAMPESRGFVALHDDCTGIEFSPEVSQTTPGSAIADQ